MAASRVSAVVHRADRCAARRGFGWRPLGEIECGRFAAAPRRVRETVIARVLIIDDAAFAEALRAHLGTIAGIEVAAVAHGGTEAVELALARDPDVILVDALMPEVDGFEVIRRVRARGSTAKAIVMSGGEPVEISEDALAVRADAYIAKLAIYDLIADVIDKLAPPEETALPAASSDLFRPERRR